MNNSENTTSDTPRIVIVGAGLGGLAAALFLAARGFQVDLYERRLGIEACKGDRGRTMNLTLSERGIKVLDSLGIKDSVLKQAVRLEGRTGRSKDGRVVIQENRKSQSKAQYAIERFNLNKALYLAAMTKKNIAIHYGMSCQSIAKDKKTAVFVGVGTNEVEEVAYDLLIGADGVHSQVRTLMHFNEGENFTKITNSWGYKEFQLNSSASIDPNFLHNWIREACVLGGIPNIDKTISYNLFFPLDDSKGVNRALADGTLKTLIAEEFPDLEGNKNEIESQMLENPTNKLVTIETAPWFHKSSIVLIGDACHATLPFLGQGVNAALEDCFELNQCLSDDPRSWAAAIERYDSIRRPNGTALASIVEDSFYQLKNQKQSLEKFITQKFNALLAKYFSGVYVPATSLLWYTDTSYAEIWRVQTRRRTMFAAFKWFTRVTLVGASAVAMKILAESSP